MPKSIRMRASISAHACDAQGFLTDNVSHNPLRQKQQSRCWHAFALAILVPTRPQLSWD